MKTGDPSFPGRDEARLGTISSSKLMGQPSRPTPSRYSHLVLASLGGLVATISPAHSQADIYKSVGADGVISFSSTKSNGAALYQKTQAKPSVFLPADTSPERTARFIKGELAKWAPIIRAADVKIE